MLGASGGGAYGPACNHVPGCGQENHAHCSHRDCQTTTIHGQHHQHWPEWPEVAATSAQTKCPVRGLQNINVKTRPKQKPWPKPQSCGKLCLRNREKRIVFPLSSKDPKNQEVSCFTEWRVTAMRSTSHQFSPPAVEEAAQEPTLTPAESVFVAGPSDMLEVPCAALQQLHTQLK